MNELVRIATRSSSLELYVEGILNVPESAVGLVIFAHGSLSGKSSIRNQFISKMLNENNIATLLFDLLTDKEQESDKQLEKLASKVPGAVFNKFNIPLLTQRLKNATEWTMRHPNEKLPLSYFGSSTGAAAALNVASKFQISSVVIRSGRSDLADETLLPKVVSPCLFLAGSTEKTVIKISKETMKKLENAPEKNLSIIANASHLFEEQGTIEKVAEISVRWIKKYFRRI
jgi:putative phosphoribosyl transferase